MTIEIKKIIVGHLKTNCYVLIKEKKALIIDPGADAEKIINTLEDIVPIAAIITHGHFDHVGGLALLKEKYKMPIYLQKEARAEYFKSKDFGNLFGFDIPNPPNPDFDLEGEIFAINFFEFSILKTPGHTKGSVCFVFEGSCFTGDTLFKGTYGRTDLPNSCPQNMIISLEKLSQLPSKTKIFPGHGKETILRNELPWIHKFINK